MESGIRWAVTSVTYSFPTSASFYSPDYGAGSEPTSGFETLNAAQQSTVRAALAMYAAVSNLTFSEIAETSSQHAVLRYAESDLPSTAWGYYPSTSQLGGDIWLNHSLGRYDSPTVGTYAYVTFIHETGHALGLKHPHEGGGNGIVPVDKDSVEYSVMSYRSYVGGGTGGYTIGATSYPQTPMQLDVAAIQAMYGANYATNSGNTVYSWSSTTGQEFINGIAQAMPAGNKILMNIWDGGGTDTYDFSNYSTNLIVDLQPGAWTTVSTTQLASLGGGQVAHGNISN
jgi:serralysin